MKLRAAPPNGVLKIFAEPGPLEDETDVVRCDGNWIPSCVQLVQGKEAVHVGDMVYAPREGVQLADADKPWVGVRVTDERTVAGSDIGLGGAETLPLKNCPGV